MAVTLKNVLCSGMDAQDLDVSEERPASISRFEETAQKESGGNQSRLNDVT